MKSVSFFLCDFHSGGCYKLNMTPDSELLSRYARTHSEDAFAELVGRHVNLVYSAALRQVNGDAHLAQDVAQTVFTDLARKAVSLSRRDSLTGWLYTSAHFAAAKIARTEDRRRDREEKFMREPIHETAPEADWEKLQPALDDAMHELKEADREAVLLRYFENRAFAEIGEKFGLNENTARMRVERALEKLRAIFAKRGITTATTLASVISANAVQLAPANLAATLASTSLAGAGTGTTFTLLKLMTATKLKLGISVLAIAGATTALVVQHQVQIKLREENQSLRQQMARLQTENERLSKHPPTPHLPAPPMHITAQANVSPTEDLQSTNWYARFKGKPPKLTAAQVEAYLKANGRKASSLLAAYRTSGDPALLKEAMEKYPNDPQVAFEAVFDKDLSPEQQRQWLNTFEQTAPDNALANYLSALNYFNSGQTDQGVQELTAASGKQQFQDYTLNRVEDDEEAYLAAGYSAGEAESISYMSLEIPQLAQVKQLGMDLVDLAKAYSQSGDQASAQAALQMAMNLGQRYGNVSAGMAIDRLVGLVVEKMALSTMDPNSPYGDSGQTVQDQLNQIAQQRAALNALGQQAGPLLPTLSDQDWISYTDRKMLFGDEAAVRWLVNKYGQK
jgi:RNA polymerase sigma factor (sigma-70 family)